MEFFRRSPDDEAAEKLFVEARWPDGVRCPRCDGDDVYEVGGKAPRMTNAVPSSGIKGVTYKALFRKQIMSVKPPAVGMAVAYVSVYDFNQSSSHDHRRPHGILDSLLAPGSTSDCSSPTILNRHRSSHRPKNWSSGSGVHRMLTTPVRSSRLSLRSQVTAPEPISPKLNPAIFGFSCTLPHGGT